MSAEMPRWGKPLNPPRIQEGGSIGPPDFVGVGAQRCGTTWWSRVIRKHPEVARRGGLPKELHYFNRFWNGEVYDGFEDEYARLFPRGPGQINGEWTPRYMHDYWVMPLLKRAAPEAKILVMLRDPVQRYLSGVARADYKAQEDGGRINLVQSGDALARSRYGEQLERVLAHFPRERVMVLQLERCQEAPEAELRKTFEFLGIDPTVEPPEQLYQVRQGAGVKPKLPPELRAELVARIAPDVELLSRLVPELDIDRWPDFGGGG